MKNSFFVFFAFASDASVTIFNRRHIKAITSSAADFAEILREIFAGENNEKNKFPSRG
jgi:hypothetical protein